MTLLALGNCLGFQHQELFPSCVLGHKFNEGAVGYRQRMCATIALCYLYKLPPLVLSCHAYWCGS